MSHSEAQLIIDLAALRRNWRVLQQQAAQGAVCAAVTKANAYGLGAQEVIPALYQEGCRTFFVASVAEGVEARALLPGDARIFVLNGLRPGGEDICLANQLIPVLFTVEQFERWRAVRRSSGLQAPCAIKFDSGMSRLGMSLEELQQICASAVELQALNPVMLISHLACADEPASAMNRQQLDVFQRALACVRQVLPAMEASLANSSGIFLGEEWHFDLLRPGAALYGVNPVMAGPSPVEPVVTLRLPVIQLRDVQGGESVGYGATYKVPSPGRLAVALGGYADGILRSAGNRAVGYLAGQRVPLVGRVSMDSVVFDVSAIPPHLLTSAEGGYVELLGKRAGVDELAQAAGTIGYEILTSLGDRYTRTYLR